MDSLNPISSGNLSQKNSSSSSVRSGDNTADAVKSATPDVHVDISAQLSSAESEAIMREAKVKEMREAI